jgi:hypothetical protein
MATDSPATDSEQVLDISCDDCKIFKSLIYPSSHFVYTVKGSAKGVLCSECANAHKGIKKIPAIMLRPLIENIPLDQPISGSFRPIKVSQDDPSIGAYQYWMDIGHMVIGEMAVWKDKVMKFTFGGNRYKGLWLKPEWNENLVCGITLAGDTPSKMLELDVYQQFRLAQMGFEEEGKTNKTWSIQLSELEGTIPNSSAIIIHILRFGYLLEPSDLNSITPTLDVDFSDPEYRNA